MNKVILMGRLVRDPQISTAGNNMAIAKYTIAVDNYKKGQDVPPDYFNCTALGKTAEFVGKYLKKGTKILLSGNMHNNNYTGKDGSRVYTIDILTESIEFTESAKKDGQQ